jgi:nicotinate-nucleotide--dimethylbenzimidazole phosphoribosyltransferase
MNIPELDQVAMQAAQLKQNSLLKPQGALGQLETLSIRIAGITRRVDWIPQEPVILVFAGDHGIVQQSVSTVPQAITAFMVGKFLSGEAAINVLARQMKAELRVIDAGINADIDAHPKLFHGKIAYGTRDFSQEPAMTIEQAQQSVQLGKEVAQKHIGQGTDILALGEMGIGSTTSASAIIAAITGEAVETVTGRGTGIDDVTLERKIELIKQSMAINSSVQTDTLQAVGGFEIGAMAGAMLYAASQRVPIILDGIICTAAALIAYQENPDVANYLISGHCGAEPGHRIALDYLGLQPLLNLDLRLGEGTGALLALPLIEASMRTLNEMGILDFG